MVLQPLRGQMAASGSAVPRVEWNQFGLASHRAPMLILFSHWPGRSNPDAAIQAVGDESGRSVIHAVNPFVCLQKGIQSRGRRCHQAAVVWE